MSRRHVAWLYAELANLVATGVLTADTADRLRAHYGPAPAAGRRIAVVILSILGAALVGGGVILLIAHNWTALGRTARTVLALLPLLVTQALTFWAITRRRWSTAWREGLGIGLSLSSAAAIALVGQTYHIPGDLENFLLTWMLLTLPVVYLLAATAPALIYFAGITFWAGYAQSASGYAAAFWLLLALAWPYVRAVARHHPHSPRHACLGWGLGLALTIGLGLALEKALPGLWLICYSALFSIMYLAPPAAGSATRGFWHRPYRAFGLGGALVMAFILSYEWPWHDIGWNHYHNHGERQVAEYLDYAITAGLLGLASLHAVRTASTTPSRALLGSGFLLATLGYALAAADAELIASLAYNGFLLATGLVMLMVGCRNLSQSALNGGLAVLATLVLLRFFDSDLDFAVRGVAFIVVGLAFLVANALVMRRARRERAT